MMNRDKPGVDAGVDKQDAIVTVGTRPGREGLP